MHPAGTEEPREIPHDAPFWNRGTPGSSLLLEQKTQALGGLAACYVVSWGGGAHREFDGLLRSHAYELGDQTWGTASNRGTAAFEFNGHQVTQGQRILRTKQFIRDLIHALLRIKLRVVMHNSEQEFLVHTTNFLRMC